MSLDRSGPILHGPVSQNNLSFCLKFFLNGNAKVTLGTTLGKVKVLHKNNLRPVVSLNLVIPVIPVKVTFT